MCIRDRVTVVRDGEESVKEIPDEGNGVKQEVQAWAASLAEGKADRLQSPEEALADLEIVSLGYFLLLDVSTDLFAARGDAPKRGVRWQTNRFALADVMQQIISKHSSAPPKSQNRRSFHCAFSGAFPLMVFRL